MGVQSSLIGTGAAVGGAAAVLKKKGTVGQKKTEGEKEAKRASLNPQNVSASDLAAERAKSSLIEHRKAKARSKNAIANFKAARAKMKKEAKK